MSSEQKSGTKPSAGETRTPWLRLLSLLALLSLPALGASTAGAQYSTPVGTRATKPKTLRATAVLEWTGSLEKPNASRLMPIAVWDGEHYQPAGLYLARPAPLAFETGTQYELERSGEPAGLFDVRGAAQLGGEWIGMGRFQPEAPPPPPPKLKASKHLPVRSDGKPESADKSAKGTGKGTGASGSASGDDDDRPTLHRKADTSASSGGASSTPSSTSAAPAPSKSSGTSAPTSSTSAGSGSQTGSAGSSSSAPASAGTAGSSPSGSGATGAAGSGAKPDAGSGESADAGAPTLHRRTGSSDPSDSSSTGACSTSASGSDTAKAADPDRPSLHRRDDAAQSSSRADADPDRPTLHRARAGGDAVAAPDPDRPHLRYGPATDGGSTELPVRLQGAPPTMQQMVAVSDASTGDPRPYTYHWASPEDRAKMQTAIALLAAQAVAGAKQVAPKLGAQFGPASHGSSARGAASSSAGRTAASRKSRSAAAPLPALTDEHFAAYELSFSGGATLVYSAHTADQGPGRIYVTLIAQPDFNGKPQVLLQQVARADRLDETPAMQLVDAVDTDNDQKAELVFQLNGAQSNGAQLDGSQSNGAPPDRAKLTEAGQPASHANATAAAQGKPAGGSAENPAEEARLAAASAAANAASATTAVPEREFAIYRVANGQASQVFATGPLP